MEKQKEKPGIKAVLPDGRTGIIVNENAGYIYVLLDKEHAHPGYIRHTVVTQAKAMQGRLL